MVLTKYKCMVCGRVTDPQPEWADGVEGECIVNDICDRCKEAILIIRDNIGTVKRNLCVGINLDGVKIETFTNMTIKADRGEYNG